MIESRTIAQYHATRVSGTGCPDDPNGKHYYAFLDANADGRICIDCGAPESVDLDHNEREQR